MKMVDAELLSIYQIYANGDGSAIYEQNFFNRMCF